MKRKLPTFSFYCIAVVFSSQLVGCNSNTSSENNNDSANVKSNVAATQGSSISAKNLIAEAPTYTMITMPSFQISGSNFKALLRDNATKVDSLEADITSVDDNGNATVQFYRWNGGNKILIPGNFNPHSSYSYPIFETSSPLRCLDGWHGVTFTPSPALTYYLVPDVTVFPNSTTLYPFYHIKTTDSYYGSSITTKQLNPIPPGQISITLY